MAPKFYANKPDNNHCVQATVLMVLNSLGHSMSWDQVNKLTKYDDRYYSWTIVAASIISQLIPNTRLVTNLDYRKFAEDGEHYLKSHWNSQWYKLQKRHSSQGFKREQQFAKEFKGEFELASKKPTAEEICNLSENNLIASLVDPHIIRGDNGTSGHFVLVYDCINGKFVYHDPGYPPAKSAEADMGVFMNALKGEFLVVPK
jgi:hypothetical protein